MEKIMVKQALPSASAANSSNGDRLTELKIIVPDELARAWQRCSWLLVNDTGRERTDIMKEMVNDYLVKYGC